MQALYDGGMVRMFQALTPEQTKLAWSAFNGASHWLVSGLVLWGVKRVAHTVQSIRPGIVNDVTANVKEHFDTRLKAHEDADDKRFMQNETQMSAINQKLGSIERSLIRRPHFGD